MHRVLVLAALSTITVRAPSSLTSGRMSEARAKGLSLADAIDISSGSEDDVIPSRRCLVGQAPGSWGQATRIPSDSPPSDTPIITSSTIRSPSVPQGERQLPFQRPSVTQRRLLAAMQPVNSAEGGRSSIASSPSRRSPATPVIRRANRRQGQSGLRLNPPLTTVISPLHNLTQAGAVMPGALPATGPRSADADGMQHNYETLIQGADSIHQEESLMDSMAHGTPMNWAPVETGDTALPWKIALMFQDTVVAHYEDENANDLHLLAAKHGLLLQFSLFKPASGAQMQIISDCAALVTVQARLGSDFHTLFTNLIKPAFLVNLRTMEANRNAASLFDNQDITLIGSIPIFIATVKTVYDHLSQRDDGTAAAGPSAQQAAKQSFSQRLINSASSLLASLGSASNVPGRAATSSASGIHSPFSFLNIQAGTSANGDIPVWPPVAEDGVPFDDEMLMDALNADELAEDNEPVDADMQEILNSMADGTFHGTDALATLYGDKGVDVAKLPLYSDTDSLRQRGLKTALHDHQLQGLLWMIKAEHRRVSTTEGTIRCLWQTRKDNRGRPYYFNIATKKCRRSAPTLPRGGINSDSMGLGKTIQIIATCLADRNRVPKGTKPVFEAAELSGSQAGAGPSTGANGRDIGDDQGGMDSEEDYMSAVEEKSRPARGSAKSASTTDSSSSDTEEESELEQTQVKRIKQIHRPTNSEGRAMESAADSETEDEDEPVGPQHRGKLVLRYEDDDSNEKEVVKGNRAKRKRKGKVPKKAEGKDAVVDELGFNETTLVICPLSVLQNWTGQVDQHCDRKKVTYYAYHGEQAKSVRRKAHFASFLSRYTFVFTTYDTIRMEYRMIQQREEQARKRAEEEEQRRQKEALRSARAAQGLSPTPSEEEEKGRKAGKKVGRHDKKGKLRAADSETPSRLGSDQESDYQPDSDEDDKSRKWYDSDDSFLGDNDNQRAVKQDTRETPLFQVKWRRVVLDEAHICRNPRTHLYTAICQLKGERRWAITGTPIVNSTKDLGALAAWCGLQPFADAPKMWSLLIERQLKRETTSDRAASLLRRVVTNICLRRHKSMKNALGTPIVKLPDVKFYKHTIPLTAADRDYYVKCELACQAHLGRWMSEGNINDHRSAILLFLLRLRQMSCHRRLIGSKLLEEIQSKDWDSVDKNKASSIQLTPDVIEALQDKLKVHVEMNDDCPVCMETLLGKEPMITPCGHPFCRACLSAIIAHGTFVTPATCPMDRLPLPGMDKMVEFPAETNTTLEDELLEEEMGSERTSAKVRECLKIVRATLKRDATEKILIFSNFVSFLNIIGEELRASDISHARFNGELDVKRRDAVLTSFGQPITPRQGASIHRTLARLEEKLQRERAEQKKTLEGEGGVASSSTSSKTSSSLLDSLRRADRDIDAKARQQAAGKGKGKLQDEDIFGENPSVLLISMGCGALGLNLTVASSVLLMDPWWQSSAEQQALDRTHRIGQTRDVKVFQIISENTVEARVLEIQATKEGLAETAFSGIRATGSSTDKREKHETSMRDLGRLFGMADETVTQLNRSAPRAV